MLVKSAKVIWKYFEINKDFDFSQSTFKFWLVKYEKNQNNNGSTNPERLTHVHQLVKCQYSIMFNSIKLFLKYV